MEERRRHDLPAAFSRTFPTDGNWKVILAGPTSSATCRPFPRRVPTPGPVGALAGPAARAALRPSPHPLIRTSRALSQRV
jgi:hypothetical protein